MLNKPVTPDLQVKEWLKKAHNDEVSIHALFKAQGSVDTICFLAQQMAEKHLKAFLVKQKKWYPKIHPLDKLWELCFEIDKSFEKIKTDCVFLTSFYVATRYPVDTEELGIAEARYASQAAVRIKEFISSKLSKIDSR